MGYAIENPDKIFGSADSGFPWEKDKRANMYQIKWY